MNFRRLLALLMALALVAAACGGSSDTTATGEGEAEGEGTESTTAEATSPTVERVESEQVDSKDTITGEVVVGEEPLADRGPEPVGTLDYAWHTAFSPVWFLPSKNTTSVSQFATQYIVHDALMKSMPGKPYWPSMAQSYSVAEDFTSAEFTLREGLTFHDGTPVTTEDVKFSYENYSGANAAAFKDNTESVEIIDDLNIKFNFNKPFLDFLLLYGSTATGAGWVIPKAYFEEVGEEGFLQAPIGAGPFKFVENQDNVKIVYEANTDWWYKNPGVQTLNFNALADSASRFAAISTGEIDLANLITGDLLETAADNPDLTIVPIRASPFWLEFIGIQDEDSPWNDIRVREAVSLALNRDEINDAEWGGSGDAVGTFIPVDWPGALTDPPKIEQDLVRAKELMAEAGFADGFDIPSVVPLAPYFPLAERIIQQLAEIGITSTVEQMDRGEFLAQVGSGTSASFAKNTLVVNISGAGGDAAARVRNFAITGGPASRLSDPVIDADFAKYEASIDPAERAEILIGIQEYILEQQYFPFVNALGFNMAQGPDVVESSTEVWGIIPQYVYAGPWENIHVK